MTVPYSTMDGEGSLMSKTTAGHWEQTGHVVLCFLANGVMILVTYSTLNLEDLLTTTPQQFTGDGLAMWCCVSWVMVSCVLSKNFESKKNWSKLVKMSINGQSSPIS